MQDIKREEDAKVQESSAGGEVNGDNAVKTVVDVASPDIPEESENKRKPETEWTRSGLEEILATVGIQCAYNIEVSLLLSTHPSQD